MPSAITIDDNDVLLVDRPAGRFHARRGVGGRGGGFDRAARQCACAPLRPCRRHPGLASGRTRLLRLDPRRDAVRRPSASLTATRRCGPTIAFRGPRARRSIPDLATDERLPHSAQGHAPGRQFLLGLCRGGRQDDDWARGAAAARAASSASSPAGLRPTIASPFPPSTRARPGSRPSSSRTPAGRSTPTIRSTPPGPE